MAITPYCLIEDVVAEAHRTQALSSTSTPTEAQVQKMINGIAGDMNLAIRRSGYVLPITEDSAVAFLKRMNAIGAAAGMERATVGHGDPELLGKDTQYYALWQEYLRMFKLLETPGYLGDLLTDKNQPEALWSKRRLDGTEEGYSRGGPYFTRDEQVYEPPISGDRFDP